MSHETRFVCRECLRRGDAVYVRPVAAGDGSGEYVCDRGHVCGVWRDGGTLDLDALRAEHEPSDDFQVFP